jgi:hypothetical protein
MARSDVGSGLATTFLWLEGYGRQRSHDRVVQVGLGILVGVLALGSANFVSMARDARQAAFEAAWDLGDRG